MTAVARRETPPHSRDDYCLHPSPERHTMVPLPREQLRPERKTLLPTEPKPWSEVEPRSSSQLAAARNHRRRQQRSTSRESSAKRGQPSSSKQAEFDEKLAMLKERRVRAMMATKRRQQDTIDHPGAAEREMADEDEEAGPTAWIVPLGKNNDTQDQIPIAWRHKPAAQTRGLAAQEVDGEPEQHDAAEDEAAADDEEPPKLAQTRAEVLFEQEQGQPRSPEQNDGRTREEEARVARESDELYRYQQQHGSPTTDKEGVLITPRYHRSSPAPQPPIGDLGGGGHHQPPSEAVDTYRPANDEREEKDEKKVTSLKWTIRPESERHEIVPARSVVEVMGRCFLTKHEEQFSPRRFLSTRELSVVAHAPPSLLLPLSADRPPVLHTTREYHSPHLHPGLPADEEAGEKEEEEQPQEKEEGENTSESIDANEEPATVEVGALPRVRNDLSVVFVPEEAVEDEGSSPLPPSPNE